MSVGGSLLLDAGQPAGCLVVACGCSSAAAPFAPLLFPCLLQYAVVAQDASMPAAAYQAATRAQAPPPQQADADVVHIDDDDDITEEAEEEMDHAMPVGHMHAACTWP